MWKISEIMTQELTDTGAQEQGAASSGSWEAASPEELAEVAAIMAECDTSDAV